MAIEIGDEFPILERYCYIYSTVSFSEKLGLTEEYFDQMYSVVNKHFTIRNSVVGVTNFQHAPFKCAYSIVDLWISIKTETDMYFHRVLLWWINRIELNEFLKNYSRKKYVFHFVGIGSTVTWLKVHIAKIIKLFMQCREILLYPAIFLEMGLILVVVHISIYNMIK